MPYKVKPKGGQFCVVKDDGKQIACHDTRPKALAQLKALYANEKADQASTVRIPCSDEPCSRAFLSFDSMLEHSDRVHGTDDAAAFPKTKKKGGSPKAGGDNIQSLMNLIKAYATAKNKPAAKAAAIALAKKLKATHRLPKAWNVSTASEDAAFEEVAFIECPDHPERDFRSVAQFLDHAEAVHTFSDIESLVQEAVREKYYKPGNYKASPPVSSVWAWTRDIAQDWVVFVVEKEGDSDLFKASYSITDGAVTLGDPVKVKRRTVYDEIKEDD